MSLDGATVGPDGKSGSLSGPADRRALAQTRRLADAILVGASTIRAERYRPMLAKAEEARRKAEEALANRSTDINYAAAQAELSEAMAQLAALRKLRGKK